MSRGEESMSKKDFFPIKTVLWANKKQKNRFLVILNQIESNWLHLLFSKPFSARVELAGFQPLRPLQHPQYRSRKPERFPACD